MISNETLLKIIGVFAFIGFGAVLIWINDFWEWLVRNDYDVYLFFTFFGSAFFIFIVNIFVKHGLKTAIVNSLILAFVLFVFYNIFMFGFYIIRETNTFVGVVVIIVLAFGFGLITEYLAERDKKKRNEETTP